METSSSKLAAPLGTPQPAPGESQSGPQAEFGPTEGGRTLGWAARGTGGVPTLEVCKGRVDVVPGDTAQWGHSV